MQVLFVEDDAMNRRVVKDMLSIVGVGMTEADSAESGLQLIDREDFNVILMDLRMPGIDGLTAIRHIRARADNKATLPVVVVTADMAADLRKTCLDSGADEVILKPVVMNTLYEVISEVVSRADAARFS